GSGLLINMLPQRETPIALHVSPDPRILAFTLLVSVFTALLFGLAPSWQASGLGINLALSSGRVRSLSCLQSGKVAVVLQVALAVQLLAGAGLFIRTLHNLVTVDAGFTRQNVIQLRLDVDATGLKPSQWPALYEQTLRRVAAVPGVQSASLAN